MWLTPLAADPVHLLGDHSTLRDTGKPSPYMEKKEDGTGDEERHFQETQRLAHSPKTNEVPFSVRHRQSGISLPLAAPIKAAAGLKTQGADIVTFLL